MTPEQSQQIQIDIATIKTLLTQLVGESGNNGRFGKLVALVDSHEAYIQQQRGGGWVIKYIITGLLGLVGGWLGSKGH